MHQTTDRIIHTTAFVTPVVGHWLEREIVVVKDIVRVTCCRHYMGYSDEQQVFLYIHHPTCRIAHTTAIVTPDVEHWMEREVR